MGIIHALGGILNLICFIVIIIFGKFYYWIQMNQLTKLTEQLSTEELMAAKYILSTNGSIIDDELLGALNETIRNAISLEYNYNIGTLKLPKLYVAFVIIAIISPISTKLLDILKVFLKKVISIFSGCLRRKKGLTKEQMDIMCENHRPEHV